MINCLNLGTREPWKIWKCPGKCMLILMYMCKFLFMINMYDIVFYLKTMISLDFTTCTRLGVLLLYEDLFILDPTPFPRLWHPQSFVESSVSSFLKGPLAECSGPVRRLVLHLAQPGHQTQPLSKSVFIRGALLIMFPDFSSLYWQLGARGRVTQEVTSFLSLPGWVSLSADPSPCSHFLKKQIVPLASH